jgi:hypothetical protein
MYSRSTNRALICGKPIHFDQHDHVYYYYHQVRLANTQHMGFHEHEGEVVLQHITMERAMDKLIEVHRLHPKLSIYATDGDFHQVRTSEPPDGSIVHVASCSLNVH